MDTSDEPDRPADTTHVNLDDVAVRPRRHLAQALDWTLWGVGMADTIRTALADKMIAALTDDEYDHAEALIVQGDEVRGGPAHRNYFIELQRELTALATFITDLGHDPDDVIAQHMPADDVAEHYRALSSRTATHWENEARTLRAAQAQWRQTESARSAAVSKLDQIAALAAEIDPVTAARIEEILHPGRRTATCARCDDPLVWHPGNGGQWIRATKGRDWMTCHGSVDSANRHVAGPTG